MLFPYISVGMENSLRSTLESIGHPYFCYKAFGGGFKRNARWQWRHYGTGIHDMFTVDV